MQLVKEGCSVENGIIQEDFSISNYTVGVHVRSNQPFPTTTQLQQTILLNASFGMHSLVDEYRNMTEKRKLWVGDELLEASLIHNGAIDDQFLVFLVRRDKPTQYIVHDIMEEDSPTVNIRNKPVNISYFDILGRIVENSDMLKFSDDRTKIVTTFENIHPYYNDVIVCPKNNTMGYFFW